MGKYSYEHWDKIEYGSIDWQILTNNLIPGNFYALMNQLLQFVPDPETVHPWVNPKELKDENA